MYSTYTDSSWPSFTARCAGFSLDCQDFPYRRFRLPYGYNIRGGGATLTGSRYKEIMTTTRRVSKYRPAGTNYDNDTTTALWQRLGEVVASPDPSQAFPFSADRRAAWAFGPSLRGRTGVLSGLDIAHQYVRSCR